MLPQLPTGWRWSEHRPNVAMGSRMFGEREVIDTYVSLRDQMVIIEHCHGDSCIGVPAAVLRAVLAG